MGRKYLLYVDILGYRGKAEEIAEETGIQEDFCRETFLRNPLRKKIEDIKNNKNVSEGISEIEGSDNYILLVDTVEEVIETIGELTRIKIPHKEFQWIPLEIGVGTKEITDDIPVEPISRTEVIVFLKEDIINPYRDYFKQTYKKIAKETFVLFTEDFHNDLESLDKNHCTNISHMGKSFFLADLEKIHERCSVLKFLSEIGYPRSRLYGRIDDVYVPPLEYDDIRKSLEEKRILIITGPPEYGKTYTAIRLLWEYYCEGYNVEWLKGEEESERIEVRKKLEDIRIKAKPHSIVYFEDPFGKTRYEKRESLEKEIGTVIDHMNHVNDSYVIITSREEVFKEFEKEKLSLANIRKFEKKLNLRKPSYDYEKRKKILEKWAEEENCEWTRNKRLKDLVLDEIGDDRNLPTPLKIRDFAIATAGINEEIQLEKKITEKSEETARAFAKEIKNMTKDKILFLLFLFISHYFSPLFIRGVYEEMLEELKLTNSIDFNRILRWFKDDKIRIGKVIEFSHPSYSEAIQYILIDDDSFTWINREILGKLLNRLAEKTEAAGDVARFLLNHFEELPNNTKNLLVKLAEKEEAARDVAWAVVGAFDKLPHDMGKKILLKLTKKGEAARDVAWAINKHFNKIPDDTKYELLLKLAEKEEASKAIAQILSNYFNEIPDNVRNELFLKLTEKKRIIRDIAKILLKSFDKLPINVKRKILLKLAEKTEAVKVVEQILSKHSDEIPENTKNEVRLKIAETKLSRR